MKINQPVTQRETFFPEGTYLVSQTDLKGMITDANDIFVEVSGFSREELLGKSHNIVRHPDMPPAAFADMWASLKAGMPWRGMVKNRAKSGDHYWVDALVVPITRDGAVTGYMSVRRLPSRQQVQEAEALYARIGHQDGKLVSIKRNPRKLETWFYVLFAAIALPILVNVGTLLWGGPRWLHVSSGVLALLPLLPLALVMHARLFAPMEALRTHIARLSEGDLSERYPIEPPTEIGQITNAFSVMQTRWMVSIDHIRTAIRNSLHNMDLVSQQSNTINGHINVQHDRVAAVAAATEEFSQAIAEVASGATEAARAAGDSESRIQDGRQIVQEGMESSKALVGAVSQAHERIVELNSGVGKISAVTQVIKDIADQTNLLALNAAIEAARAGELGRGFAVVADEVRKLAERTAGSTGEINAMIVDIQRLSTQVDNDMVATTSQVADSTAKMQESVDCFEAVAVASEQTMVLAGHIANASDQQRQAGLEVARNMEHVADLSEKNQMELAGLWQALDELHAAAAHIDNSIGAFRLFPGQRGR